MRCNVLGDFICDWFRHNPQAADKSSDDHYHICANTSNELGRCGFNSATDSKKCKLYEDNKKREDLNERCDFCGNITTDLSSGDKVPLRYHFHNEKEETMCLECSGLSMDQWTEARKKSNPKFLWSRLENGKEIKSQNAGWLKEWGSMKPLGIKSRITKLRDSVRDDRPIKNEEVIKSDG